MRQLSEGKNKLKVTSHLPPLEGSIVGKCYFKLLSYLLIDKSLNAINS